MRRGQSQPRWGSIPSAAASAVREVYRAKPLEAKVRFGNQGKKRAKVVTITNTGAIARAIANIKISDAAPAQFLHTKIAGRL
jgi:hypothetical protein